MPKDVKPTPLAVPVARVATGAPASSASITEPSAPLGWKGESP